MADETPAGFCCVPRLVIDIGSEIGSYAVHVYLALLSHASDSGEAWPSINTLAKLTGMTKQSVRNQIQKLKTHGVIAIESRKIGDSSLTNLYRIHPTYLHSKRNRPGVNETVGGWSTKHDEGGQRNDTRTRSNRTIPNELKTDDAVSIPDSLNDPRFLSAWEDFRRHRCEKRSKMTPTAISKALAKMERWGIDRAVAALEHSTEQGWTGIFEPSSNGTKPTKKKYGGTEYDPTATG